jgi:CRISPR-associated protein Csx14
MSIRVNVDLTNPGQFFACCGLLELADRFWPGAEGWFGDRVLHIECGGRIDLLLAMLVMDPPDEVTELDNGLPVKPLIAPLRFSFDGGATHSITLDSWITVRADKGQAVSVANPPWNFWSGQQTALSIWRDLRLTLAKQLRTLMAERIEDLFSRRVLLSGRYGFDPGAAWNALDVGFSPNEQKMDVASSAAVELLAAVGIQRFRPKVSNDRQSFEYSTWGHPLPPSIAAAAVGGSIIIPPMKRFRGQVVSRGSYAALGHSTTVRGDICHE